MLTINNIKTILYHKFGVLSEWELIDIDADDWDDEYEFQFKKWLPGNHAVYHNIILNRKGKYSPHVGKIVYTFGGGLYTADFLQNKKNVKDIIENILKTK